MPRTRRQLRDDALAIWRAGLDAVRSERLMWDAVQTDGNALWIDEEPLDLGAIRRIAVVGAGKAGAGMAAALEKILGPRLLSEKYVSGLINVPADCVRPLQCIQLNSARPAGRNEPTEAGVEGTAEILRIVESLHCEDLCIALISGGASALMPAPIAEVTLADKLAITRHLSAAGANIRDLNTVRKQLSRVKGGGLLRACRAGKLISLIISDVIGDPLDIIGSGPTVPDTGTPAAALAVVEAFHATEIAPNATRYLSQQVRTGGVDHSAAPLCEYRNVVIGNNARAVDAAGIEAERRGYSHAMHCAREMEGAAEGIGRHLAHLAVQMRDSPGPDCLITGGEPVVTLVPEEERGLGGRNQQLVLAAAVELAEAGRDGIVLLSGATDGEDGPTNAAGAIVDSETQKAAELRGLLPEQFLRTNDAYHFFEPLGDLIVTGPTHTNVCDVRVVVVTREESPTSQESGS